MTIALGRFSAGQTTYIASLNSIMTTLETAINGLLAATTTGTTTGTGTGAVGLTEIWEQNGLVGASSFPVTCATSQTLSVGSGAAWILGQQTMPRATSAVTLTFAGKASGVYAIITDGAGGLSISALSATVAGSSLQIYSVQFNAPNFGSAARLVPILFQGDDHQRMLSSPIFGSFARVADRLSALDNALTVDALYAQSFVSATSWSYKSGHLRNNNAIVSTTAGTLALAASATHYVEVAISTGTVSYATGGWTASEAIALRKLVTSGSVIISNEDVRTWAQVAGGAGGVAGLANSGTTDGTWILYRGTGATSALPSAATLVVDRGSNTDVAIRYNPSAGTSGAWQYTDNGSTYYRFGEVAGLQLGSGLTTRVTLVASAPAVLATTVLSTTGSTVLISLSGLVSTTTTAVWLRGTAFDSAMASLGTSAEPFPGVAFYRDSATLTAAAVAKIYAQHLASAVELPQMVLLPVSGQLLEYQAWAASDGSLRCSVYLVAYVDLITGPGPQVASATVTGLTASVGANAYVLSSGQFSGFMNRGLVTYLETSGTLGAGSTYDVEFYASAGAATSQLLFQALTIDASAVYITRLPFAARDLASQSQVYLRLSNAGASAGLFSLHWQGDRFA